MRWYHGTSKQNAEKILKEGVLKPGEHSVYREDVPRYDAVYLTSDWQIAKYYSEERGKDGVVLEVSANESNLMPDEDSIYDALHEGAVSLGGKANKKLGQAIRNEWFKYWKSIGGTGDTFEEAWEAWGEVEAEGSSGIAEEMKALTEEIHEKNPALSKAIIKASGKAAHIGPAKVVGIAKKADRKTAAHPNDDDRARMERFRAGMRFPLTVYRAIDKNPDDINMEGIGPFWTVDENCAEPHYDGKKLNNPTIVRAQVLEDDIDWEETFYQNMRYAWSEQEVYLKQGKDIKLTGIKQRGGWETPTQQYAIASKTAKKVTVVKTPGFVVEVPQERRQKFFIRPKAPLEYWAFKNRPRVFINEPLIFTFGGKPVAKAVVVKVETPGRGEGEYKDWHKVYWKPSSFRRFKAAAKVTPEFEEFLDAVERWGLSTHTDREGTESDLLKYESLARQYTTGGGTPLYRGQQLSKQQHDALKAGKTIKIPAPGKLLSFSYSRLSAMQFAEFSDTGYGVVVRKDNLDEFLDFNVLAGHLEDMGIDTDEQSIEGNSPLGDPIREKEVIVKVVGALTIAPDEVEKLYPLPGKGMKSSLLKRAAKKPKPRILYHGTASENVPAILKHGLDPAKSRSGSEGVYLAGDVFTAENYENMYLDLGDDPQGWTILSINVSKLDENLLEVDDDDFAKDLFFQLPERTQSYYGDDPYNVPWWKSVEYSGQCVYMGKVSPAAIAVVSSKKAAAAKLPTFEQVTDKDPNNEFNIANSAQGVADMWEDRNLSNMKEYYDEVIPKLGALKFPLTVYRCFAMRFKGDKIDYSRLGGSWSLTREAANSTVRDMFTSDEYEGYKTVTGKIASPDAVDWLNTVRAWMTLPEEQEIRMKSGAKVMVQGKPRMASEVLDPDPNTDPDYYMVEGCGIYAVDFARKNGGEIYILAAERGEEWSEEIPYEVTHAFVKKDGKTFDVRGERTPDKMAWELSMGEYTVKGPWAPDEFEAKFMGDSDERPLYGKSGAAKLPKGWKVTLKKDKDGFYSGHIWRDGQFYQQCGIASEYADKAREAAIDWAWTASGQERPKTAGDRIIDVGDGDEYWAGEGNAASGVLPICPQKGTVCLAWRSQFVMSPGCWGTIGGAVQQGKNPQQSAREELKEEMGYSGGMTLIPAYVFTDRGFSYHNFVGIVSNEFTMAPKPYTQKQIAWLEENDAPDYQFNPGWETDHIVWVPYQDLLEDMKANSGDYHPGVLKLFQNSKDAIERALKITKTAAHNPSCKCEMCRSIPAWKRPWLTGKCHEFALALAGTMPDAQFVGIGGGMFEHVGIRKGNTYYDVRGAMTKDQFAELFGSNANSVRDVDRQEVLRDSFPSYIGYEGELAETSDLKSALKAVRRVFGKTAADVMESRRPCPSGKRKYFDEVSAIGPHKQWDPNTPALRAYKCPKCGWFHLTKKPQKFAEQTHMFPSSQDAKFKAWFDGSKVVDKNGNPKPVFHGTRSSVDFEEFSVEGPPYVEDEERATSSGSGADPTAFMGAHFAEEPNVAGMFAEGKGWTSTRYEGEAEKPRVVKVYLRITNPKDFGSELNLRDFINQGKITDDDVLQLAMQNDGIRYWEEDEATQKTVEDWYNKYDTDQTFRVEQNTYLFEYHSREEGDEEVLSSAAADLARNAKQRLATAGYDGVRYKNVVEGGTAWIAFEPNQIKSAYAQEFNPRDPRFTASKDAASHTMEYAQKLIATLKQTVHEADFKVIGSVGTGKESENDLDILVNLHPDAVFEDKDWIESSGLMGAMKLMGFDYHGPSEFGPGDSAEKSEISGKYLDPEGSSVEKFFNPNTMHTVEFWFTESGMPKDASWVKKAAGFAFKSFKKLWHVGSMKVKDKQEGSLEGAGLSVSVNPEEWMQIAEISGDLWELTKPGNKFLNFHRLSKPQRQQIMAWGIKNGYVTEVSDAWRLVYYDSESDEERYMEFLSKQEAEAELGNFGEDEKIVPVKDKTVSGTDKLKQRTKNPNANETAVAFDLLVTVYAEDELDCDGVWWQDTLDPLALSAPRGVIFPSKLSSWKAEKAQDDEEKDEDVVSVAPAGKQWSITFGGNFVGVRMQTKELALAKAKEWADRQGLKFKAAAYDPARAAQFSIKVMNHPTNSSIFEVRAYGDEGWAGTVSVVQKGEDFYVSQSVLPPSTQGIGLGSRLYAWAMDEAENRGGKRFWSDTEVSQDATKIWDRLPSVEFDEKSGRYYTPLAKTANKLASAVQPFYHGTTWAAADKIDKEGLKAHKWQFSPESYVWASILPETGHSYGLSSSDEDDYAVVTFLWDYDKTEPDPEHEGDTDVYRRIPSNVPRSAIKKIEYFDWNRNLVKTASNKAAAGWKKLPATDEWIAKAKGFLKDKWAERHKELGRDGVPTDLAGACKFASMFAQKLFGGRMVGTAEHQALKLSNGRMLDLTDIYNPNTFKHDKEFWLNPEHEESLKSCEPRVQQWVDEFYQKYWQDYFKNLA